jgi:hypothetical protein
LSRTSSPVCPGAMAVAHCESVGSPASWAALAYGVNRNVAGRPRSNTDRQRWIWNHDCRGPGDDWYFIRPELERALEATKIV